MLTNRRNPETNISHSTQLIWWARPHFICIWQLFPIVVISYFFSDQLSTDRHVTSHFGGLQLLALIGMLLVIFSSSLIGYRIAVAPPPSHRKNIPTVWLDIFFWVSAIAFTIWFYALLSNPALFLSMLLGEDGTAYTIREDYSTIPGVTTLVQAGVAYMCVMAFLYPDLKGIKKRHKYFGYLILVMAVFRTFAWSERLSLIELIIPLLLTYAVKTKNKRFSLIFRAAPLVGFSALFVLFGITEYFRSWTITYQNKYDSLIEFIALRISEYYFFAINNGLGIISESQSSFPHYSMAWLLKFPIVGDFLVSEFGIDSGRYQYLATKGLLEFNNFGGILALVSDFGVLGGGIATVLLGFAFGRGARCFSYHRDFLGLLFPIFFVALLDLPRIYYLGESRAFIPIILLGIAWLSRR
ncbi:MAG: oligosaccharide repeat unit polymerase [Nevskia sp.]|nr:oligosaccharide repeat unit polymerase [Nevskia sp.]